MTGAPPVAIDQIAISGVSPAEAPRVEAALHAALTEAVASGRLAPAAIPHLRLNLPAGATARDIAKALAKALGPS
jgi:hypothetical protein